MKSPLFVMNRPDNDPLSDLIALLRPHAAFSKAITGRGVWGVEYAPYKLPGFAIVLHGRCFFAAENATPVVLERGDFLLLPATPAFSLSSHPDVPCVPGRPSANAVRHGDPEGEPDFQMLGGSFQIDPINSAVLIQLLPESIHIRSSEGDTGRLARLIDLIAEECADDKPGSKMIIERLLEVLLVESLRWSSLHQGTASAGLLAGMRDPAIASALRAIHSNVQHGWTVAELAKHAGMSRSAFAARFVDVVGSAPREYLSGWRMTLAQDSLCHGEKSLDQIAEELGYQSASAFSTAFRARTGCAPGRFSRSRRFVST
jgi:AraC-like DNA-binding protein